MKLLPRDQWTFDIQDDTLIAGIYESPENTRFYASFPLNTGVILNSDPDRPAQPLKWETVPYPNGREIPWPNGTHAIKVIKSSEQKTTVWDYEHEIILAIKKQLANQSPEEAEIANCINSTNMESVSRIEMSESHTLWEASYDISAGFVTFSITQYHDATDHKSRWHVSNTEIKFPIINRPPEY